MYYRQAFPAAQYNATGHVWTFPSGAKIYFGSMQYTKDRTNYQGKAFDFIGFDELTHFEWEEYSYMMSRNRPTGPGTRVHLPGDHQPRRGGPWLGQSPVHHTGASGHPHRGGVLGPAAGRQHKTVPAGQGIYSLQRI